MNEKTKILDIGCGTGGQTLNLANNTAAQITAVDMLPQFLETLMKNAKENNLLDRIAAKDMLMDNLTFDKNSFDVIWSEGAIYNIGFEKGLSLWRNYLKDNGYIAVSEISWLTDTRPEEIQQYWVNAYPEIDTIENKLSVIEKCGYTSVVHPLIKHHIFKANCKSNLLFGSFRLKLPTSHNLLRRYLKPLMVNAAALAASLILPLQLK